MEGECLCKAIKVKVNDDNLFGTQRRGHICHCANCRKVAGGLFGVNLIIEEDKVEFVKGKDVLKKYSVRAIGCNQDNIATSTWFDHPSGLVRRRVLR